MTARALVVFAKEPRAGAVKTRLCPPLLPDQAAELYACMLGDVLDESARACEASGAALWLAVHPPDAVARMAERAPAAVHTFAQRGEGLAARMADAFASAHAQGFEQVVLRGSDSPALPAQRVEQAFGALDAADVVIARDADGGYDLIGAHGAYPGLVDHPMSTASVADDTLANAARLGLRAIELEPGFDLDTVDDLRRLRAVRASLPGDRCPRTLAKLDAEQWYGA